MRLKIISILIAVMIAAPLAAHANTITVGPLTFGSSLPFGVGGLAGPFGQQNVATFFGAGLYLNSVGTPDASISQTIAFTFDIAPGWAITGINLYDSTDFGFLGQNGPNPTPYSNWGYEYAQQVTLCSANNVCSTGSYGQRAGGASLPSIPFNAQAGPGAGVYQIYAYTHNTQIASVNPTGLNIFLTQVAVTPEPETFVLLGTGALGLIGAFRRRLS